MTKSAVYLYGYGTIFKCREPDDSRAFCATRATGLVEMVINAIHEKCRIVNQVSGLETTVPCSRIHLTMPANCDYSLSIFGAEASEFCTFS